MITFERRTAWQRLLRLIPTQRRKQDAAIEDAIARLVADPSLPCVIDGKLVLDGWSD